MEEYDRVKIIVKNRKDIEKAKIQSMNSDSLFDRVVSILEQSRSRLVQTVNSEMIIAYWLIGREIVQAIQGGEERAEYGNQIIITSSATQNLDISRVRRTT